MYSDACLYRLAEGGGRSQYFGLEVAAIVLLSSIPFLSLIIPWRDLLFIHAHVVLFDTKN